jgi:hypothetical protein
MGVDDYLESPVAVAAAATAVLLSPRVRGVMRKGLVYGTAGVMTAGDAVVSAAKETGKGVQRAVSGGPAASEASPRSSSSATKRTRGRSGSGGARSGGSRS